MCVEVNFVCHETWTSIYICILRLLKSTCRLFMDPLTAVRYPSVTRVLSPDVTGVRELPGSRHSGGSEEEAGAGRRQTSSQAQAIMMTHSVGAGAAQWSHTAWHAPGAAIICNGSNPDPLIISLQRATLPCLPTRRKYKNTIQSPSLYPRMYYR